MPRSTEAAPKIRWFGKHDIQLKTVLLGRVYTHLEGAYRDIGGINLGSGFHDPAEMLRSIPVWRLVFEGAQLVSVMVFKEKAGRLKMVAYAAESASETVRKNDLRCMVRLSHAELSGALLIAVLKQFGPAIRPHLLNPDKVLPERETFSLAESGEALHRPENSRILARLKAEFPDVLPFLYVRNIGGRLKLKLLVGSFRRVQGLLALGRLLSQAEAFLTEFKTKALQERTSLDAGSVLALQFRRSAA
jgi:hypothetical protein